MVLVKLPSGREIDLSTPEITYTEIFLITIYDNRFIILFMVLYLFLWRYFF